MQVQPTPEQKHLSPYVINGVQYTWSRLISQAIFNTVLMCCPPIGWFCMAFFLQCTHGYQKEARAYQAKLFARAGCPELDPATAPVPLKYWKIDYDNWPCRDHAVASYADLRRKLQEAAI